MVDSIYIYFKIQWHNIFTFLRNIIQLLISVTMIWVINVYKHNFDTSYNEIRLFEGRNLYRIE